MNFIVSHMRDVHRDFTIRGSDTVSTISEGVTKADASGKCMLAVSTHHNDRFDGGRYNMLTQTDSSYEIPLGKLAGANAQLEQPLHPDPGQSISPVAEYNALFLTASTDAIRETTTSTQSGTLYPEKNGTETKTSLKNKVAFFGDDKQILPRLATAFTHAIQLCGGKKEPF